MHIHRISMANYSYPYLFKQGNYLSCSFGFGLGLGLNVLVMFPTLIGILPLTSTVQTICTF